MSLIRKHVAVLQAWACLDLVDFCTARWPAFIVHLRTTSMLWWWWWWWRWWWRALTVVVEADEVGVKTMRWDEAHDVVVGVACEAVYVSVLSTATSKLPLLVAKYHHQQNVQSFKLHISAKYVFSNRGTHFPTIVYYTSLFRHNIAVRTLK